MTEPFAAKPRIGQGYTPEHRKRTDTHATVGAEFAKPDSFDRNARFNERETMKS